MFGSNMTSTLAQVTPHREGDEEMPHHFKLLLSFLPSAFFQADNEDDGVSCVSQLESALCLSREAWSLASYWKEASRELAGSYRQMARVISLPEVPFDDVEVPVLSTNTFSTLVLQARGCASQS
jgi:hypothetical protein